MDNVFGPFDVALVAFFGIAVFGQRTGASYNLLRTLSPTFVTNNYTKVYLHLIGQIICYTAATVLFAVVYIRQ